MAERGRPPVYDTDEERRKARAASTRKSKEKTKNISVDDDLVEIINKQADALVKTLGFRPTISQTLRYMLRRIGEELPEED